MTSRPFTIGRPIHPGDSLKCIAPCCGTMGQDCIIGEEYEVLKADRSFVFLDGIGWVGEPAEVKFELSPAC